MDLNLRDLCLAPNFGCQTALAGHLDTQHDDGMRVHLTRSLAASAVSHIAGTVLVLLGLWLALIDSFFVMRGRPPTGIATILGLSALITGSLAIGLGKKILSHDRFAIGLVTGAALVTGAVAASIGAWVIPLPALVVVISSWRLRDGRGRETGRSAHSDRSFMRTAA